MVCQNCRAVNQDPGGDLYGYLCGVCGHRALARVAYRPTSRAEAGGAAGGAVFGALLGAILAPGFGWILGAAIGGLVGASETRGRQESRRRKRLP